MKYTRLGSVLDWEILSFLESCLEYHVNMRAEVTDPQQAPSFVQNKLRPKTLPVPKPPLRLKSAG